jgi:hypothetical protein
MKEIVVEEFDSLTQYIDVIGSRKLNTVFSSSSCSLSSTAFRHDMPSYEESVELAKNGYKEGLNNLISTNDRFQHHENIPKNMPDVDFVGYAPHVANAIAGVPKAMVSVKRVEQKAKIITIYYGAGDTGGSSVSNYITAGKNILSVINTLESRGYRVSVVVLHVTFSDDQFAVRLIRVKHWRQPSNPLKLAFPLLHPSFQRRFGFKWLETHPDIEDSYFDGTYGHTFNRNYSIREQRQKLMEIGVLKQGCFYTSLSEAMENDAVKLIKLLGIK